MSPYVEEKPIEDQVYEAADPVILNLMTPTDSSSSYQSVTDDNNSSGPESLVHEPAQNILGILEDIQRYHVSLDFNLKQLLTTVCGAEDLDPVTEINLKVITIDATLQQLGGYLPSLRKLVLDGSVVSSLRDLGCGLKNLKVLSVNRCGLSCIDGVFGFERLEEFYAADNEISDLTPCAFLANIKIIDVRRNSVKSLQGLSFLNLCPLLENLSFAGNLEFDESPDYRNAIKRMLPRLKMLDERDLQDLRNVEEHSNNMIDVSFEGGASSNNHELFRGDARRVNLPRRRPLSNNDSTNQNGFVVRFPPRVFTNRPIDTRSVINSINSNQR